MVHYNNKNIWHNLLFLSEEFFARYHSVDNDYDELIILYDTIHKESVFPLHHMDVLIRRWSEIPEMYRHSFQLKIQTMQIVADKLLDSSWPMIVGYHCVLSKEQWINTLVHNDYFLSRNAEVWQTLEEQLQMDIWTHSLYSQKPIEQSNWQWTFEQWTHCINHCFNERLLSILHINNDLEQLWKYLPVHIKEMVAHEELWFSVKKHQLLAVFDSRPPDLTSVFA